jgi:hypothetical protein
MTTPQFILLLGSFPHGGELTSAASLKLLSSVTLKTTNAQSQQLNGGWSLCKKQMSSFLENNFKTTDCAQLQIN